MTMDKARPVADMVAIKGQRILKVGSAEDLRPYRGTGTQIIDCQGKTVLPGFIDSHCHPLAMASQLLSVDCGPRAVSSIAGIQERLRQRANQTPKGKWIKATGYHEFYLAEKRHPNRWELDRAVPNHPVKLTHQSGHACVLNSLALQLLDITIETPEPEGAIIDRDLESGEPNGILFEMNTYVDSRIPPLSDADLEKGAGLADQELLSHGITSVQDASWGDALRRWNLLHRFKERGQLRPRVSMMIGIEEVGEWEAAKIKAEEFPDLRQSGVKVVIHTTTGVLNPPQEELNKLVFDVHRRNYQVAIHAVELETVEAAVTALEHALRKEPRPGHRHRIEHCSICPPPLLHRIKAVGAMVVTQPPFVLYNGDRYLATVDPEEQPWLYAIGSLRAAGIRVAGSSDAPVVPVSPMMGIYSAVTRMTQTNRAVSTKEAVSIQDALALYTIEGAFSSFAEDINGSITEAKLADLVVLSEDPTAVPPERLKDLKVIMTILGGQVVWQK